MTAERLRWRAVITGALVVTLVRPLSWAIGLAGFLAGGGIIVMTWPILVLPTPTGLQNALGGPVSSIAFGAPSAVLVTLIVVGGLIAVLLVVAGICIGAWAEREGIAIAIAAAADEALIGAAPAVNGSPGWPRIAVIRSLSLVPVIAVALLASRTLYDVTYRELILPDDLVTPLPIRIIGDVPGIVLAVFVAWLLADTAASVGVRRLVLERRPVLVAWLLGWADIVRRPLRVLPTAVVGVGVMVLAAGPGLVAASVGWTRVRDVILSGRDPLTVLAAVLIWVGVWLGALALAGVGSAIRSAAWTLELPLER